MKKFLYMSLIQGDATSLEELQAERDLNEQELALVTGGTSEHGPHHGDDDDDRRHRDDDDRHHDDWDHWHRHDWDDKRHHGHK